MKYYHINRCSVDVDGDSTICYNSDHYIAIPDEFAVCMRYDCSENDGNDEFVNISEMSIETAAAERVAYIPPYTWLSELLRLMQRDYTLADLRDHYDKLIDILKRVDKSRPVTVQLVYGHSDPAAY